MLFSRVFTVTVTITLAACALSPQTVSISPTIEIPAGNYQQLAKSLAITVTDSRNSQAIGTRGGIYKETSQITPAATMTASVKSSITNSFRILGYSVVDNNSDVSLAVNITDLKYNAFGDRNVTAVETSAAVRIICRNRDFTMNNEYRTTNKQDVLKAPSTNKNEQIINDTLSLALQGMFSDDKLLECINR
jgi:uncharacterized lipoprotein